MCFFSFFPSPHKWDEVALSEIDAELKEPWIKA